jgi:hypothetical protein
MVRDAGIGPVERLQPALDQRPRAIHVPLDLVRIDEYRPAVPLSLVCDKPVTCNTDLVTLEYSTTRVERHPASGKVITRLNPAVRMGHMTHHVDVETMGGAGQQALELSFPALEGASGAPVMFDRTPSPRKKNALASRVF